MSGSIDRGATIAVDTALLDRLLALAAASPGEEVCGLLFGGDDRVAASMPAANVASDRTRAFEVDPAILLAAHRAARDGGPRPIGHYHSHPSGSAEPSPRDVAAATPGQLWLIVGGGEARLWRALAGDFAEVAIRRV